VQWGDRLFYPSNRSFNASTPKLTGAPLNERAQNVRRRITATVVRRAPQVMVKVTGGGRGMGAIAAHLRYISKNGRLSFEDDRGVAREGKEALRDLAEQWRNSGAQIPKTSARREAFNIMLSMPSGTDPELVRRAARKFGKAELANHRYVMVLHTHQANPHVHLSARAAGRDGKRLNPRKEDLHRWRETFAGKLRDWGIEAEASPQATRGANRRSQRVWERQPGTVALRPTRRVEVRLRLRGNTPSLDEGLGRDRQGLGRLGGPRRPQAQCIDRRRRVADAVGALDANRTHPARSAAAARRGHAARRRRRAAPIPHGSGDQPVAASTEVHPSSPPDGLGGRSPKQPPAREPQRAGAPRRVKGSLAPGCARP
jgi:Relaxase/Mobilisation nuclease domain